MIEASKNAARPQAPPTLEQVGEMIRQRLAGYRNAD